jgi:hypothetical protein
MYYEWSITTLCNVVVIDVALTGNNMKRTQSLKLVLIPTIALAACDSTDHIQRDMYTKVSDCMADWSDSALCSQVPADAALEYSQTTGAASIASGEAGPITEEHKDSQQSGHSSVVPSMLFWGPNYASGSRSVDYNGATYTPSSNNAARAAFNVSRSSLSVAKVSPGAIRGGWGGTAARVGGAVGS